MKLLNYFLLPIAIGFITLIISFAIADRLPQVTPFMAGVMISTGALLMFLFYLFWFHVLGDDENDK